MDIHQMQEFASLIARSNAALIKAIGMQADNKVQECKNEYPNWYMHDFERILHEYRLTIKDIDESLFKIAN